MDLIAFLLFPILIFVTLVRVVSPKNKGRRLRIAALILGIPSLIFFSDELVGQSYLYLRCATEGGLHTTGNVNAEGYFNPDDSGCDSECVYALLKRNFKYYEVDAVRGYSFTTTETRVNKFYLKDKLECLDDRRRDLSNSARQLIRDFMPQGKCIAVTTLLEPESRYEYSKPKNSPVWPFRKVPAPTWSYPARLHKQFSYVKDRRSGELVASYTSFWWWGGWLRNSSFSHNGATVCPAIGSINSDVRDIISAPEK